MKNNIFSGGVIWVSSCISKWICFHKMNMSRWGHSIFFSEQLSPRSEIKMLIDYASSLFPTSHSWLRMDSVEFQKQQAGESGGDFLRYFHWRWLAFSLPPLHIQPCTLSAATSCLTGWREQVSKCVRVLPARWAPSPTSHIYLFQAESNKTTYTSQILDKYLSDWKYK